MIRFAPSSRIPSRFAVASVVGIAGALALAGCSTATGTDATTSGDTGTSDGTAATYADGTYTAEGSYQTPESVETITVTLTIADSVVTDVEVTGDPQKPESQQYQSQFIGGISDEVVGKSLDEISVSRVAGSSLTSGGFNAAVDEIKAEAAV